MSKVNFDVFLNKRPRGLMMAFNTYDRPILEYATVVWSLVLRQDIRKLEVVQKRFTKRLHGMQII